MWNGNIVLPSEGGALKYNIQILPSLTVDDAFPIRLKLDVTLVILFTSL